MSAENLPELIREALRKVRDPEIGQDIVTLGMLKDVTIRGSNAVIAVELTTPACPLKGVIERDIREAVAGLPGIGRVEVAFSARVRGGAAREGNPIPGVRNSIAVASGKGGVGKSTVAVNLAAALVMEGARVGLLDCDIYGPSVPKMTGTAETAPEATDTKLLPIKRHGLALMSIGYLIPPGQSVVWRGPLIHKAVQQFLNDVDWGELDYLIVDLPPGTGDAQLSLSQTIPLTGAVMVTTPQEIALIDVRRGADMFAKVNVPILGVVENMSYFLCPGSDTRIEIFGRGGGRRVAEELGVPLLGELPIEVAVREGGDRGVPSVASHPASACSLAFREAARALAARVSVLRMTPPGPGPKSP
ncbi:MAG: Mrp/NBP35 family ATP-binding protein [Planctomycetes bacterium]|jgi:ATP-binding protein involved in chromosome partitioning|nr:Mrp/NBP35 family ATP-binding protein [Planctomycetota bacterium]